MEKDISSKIMTMRVACEDKEIEKLHKTLSGIKNSSNYMLDNTILLLSYIDNGQININGKMVRNVLGLIAKGIEIPENQVIPILKFIEEQLLIEVIDEKIILTPYGKLFILSDRVSAGIDMIKYVFEQLDWKEVTNCLEDNKFLDKDSRRYTSCLLSQISLYGTIPELLINKEIDLELIISSNIYMLYDLLKDKYMGELINSIFEPMGLIRKCENNYCLTEWGLKVFDHYSYNMLKEYNELIDECWENYDKGNFQEAFESAASIIKVSSTILEAYNIIGCVYIRKGEYEKAKNIFKYGIKLNDEKTGVLNPNLSMSLETYISMYYNLGLCDFYMGKYINAMHTFSNIKKTLPYKIESLETIMATIKKFIIV